MTVGELKEILNNYDEDMDVKTFDDNGDYVNIDLKQHTITQKGQNVDVLIIW